MPAVGEAHVGVVVAFQVAAEFVVRWQFGCIFGELLDALEVRLLVGGFLPVGVLVSLGVVDDGVEVGDVDVVVDVAVGVGREGVIRRETPLAVYDELVLMQSAWELLA